jgi:hypothetical protein
MSLITVANFQTATDSLAGSWDKLAATLGKKADSPPVAGTCKNAANNLLNLFIVTAQDYQQILDMAAAASACLNGMYAEALVPNTPLAAAVASITAHCQNRGSSVAASIVDQLSYLSYYNGGGGAAKFSSMVVPSYAALYKAITGLALPAAGVLSPGLDPVTDSVNSANGMGIKTVGGAFTAGSAVTTASYSEVTGIAVVSTNIGGGTGTMTITVAGVDSDGNNTTTWSATTDVNNPTAAFTQTTISGGAVNAQARQTVTCANTMASRNIVPGSTVTINKGLPDQEKVKVEAVAGSTFTAVFQQAHLINATVDGNNSYTLTPSVGGKRIRSVSGITFTVNGQNAGVVRIDGVQDRVGV